MNSNDNSKRFKTWSSEKKKNHFKNFRNTSEAARIANPNKPQKPIENSSSTKMKWTLSEAAYKCLTKDLKPLQINSKMKGRRTKRP